MTNKEQIQQHEERIRVLDIQMTPFINEKLRLKQAVLELKSQFSIGDVIQWKAGKQIRRGKVLRIREWRCGDPMWVVQFIRKDGSTGEMVEVRDYMNPSKI